MIHSEPPIKVIYHYLLANLYYSKVFLAKHILDSYNDFLGPRLKIFILLTSVIVA